MKVKMTATKLLALRDKRDLHREKFNLADQKLRDLCTHPKSRMVTVTTWYSDTLGNGSYSRLHDECLICEKWFGSYSGEPNYREKRK